MDFKQETIGDLIESEQADGFDRASTIWPVLYTRDRCVGVPLLGREID